MQMAWKTDPTMLEDPGREGAAGTGLYVFVDVVMFGGKWRGFIRNREKLKSAHYLVPLMTETKPLSVQKPDVWDVWEWNLGSSLQGSTQMNYRTTKSVTTHSQLHPSNESIIHSSHPSDLSCIQSVHASTQPSINIVLKFIPIMSHTLLYAWNKEENKTDVVQLLFSWSESYI